jgi:GMP synthase (glutamine-hydrolysing)
MSRAVILMHEPFENAALFGQVMRERGITQQERLVPQEGIDSDDLSADFLMIMGGPMGVYETAEHPFLVAEINFIEQWLKSGKPIIGICLGSQLMAKALGANVYKGKAGQEIGWYDIRINAPANDPVAHLGGTMFHWHGDTFDLPQGATLLASSDKYAHQIYRYGKNALAIQSHPEVTAPQLEDWYSAFAGQVNPDKINTLRIDTAKHITQLNTKGRKFFETWLQSVGL